MSNKYSFVSLKSYWSNKQYFFVTKKYLFLSYKSLCASKVYSFLGKKYFSLAKKYSLQVRNISLGVWNIWNYLNKYFSGRYLSWYFLEIKELSYFWRNCSFCVYRSKTLFKRLNFIFYRVIRVDAFTSESNHLLGNKG